VAAAALARLLRECAPCVVLTGAGVSTESGIPDFRSRTGIWAKYDPSEYATIDAFHRDPAKVWDFYALRLRVLLEARPNAAHVALAELERAGVVGAIVTQNVDRLHTLAGSREVVEVHGSIRAAACLGCGDRVELDGLLELLAEAVPPRCAACGGLLKPTTVLFGEQLPAGALERAAELARGTRLLLVVGSTLEVYPVAGLPEETHAAGGRVAILNRGATAYDPWADLRVEGAAGDVLAAVAAELA
jgi:NAD-dependent deacetylase